MTQLEIVIGAHEDYPLQCWNRGTQTTATFLSTDVITAYVYQGQSETQLFSPTMSFFTDGGTQTGFDQGQVLATIGSTQAGMLEANGLYTLIVWKTPQGSTETSPVWRGGLLALPASGATTQTITAYCKLSDMLQYAPWVRDVQGFDVDQEGFYSQRLQARNWMDWAIINNYRGASVGNFEFHSTLAFAFGGGVGWRRGTGPSPSLIGWLQSNFLIVRPQIIEACTYKAISEVGLTQITRNSQQANFGAYFRDMAERIMTATTAEIDINQDGIGEIFINLGSTNTLFT